MSENNKVIYIGIDTDNLGRWIRLWYIPAIERFYIEPIFAV